MGDKDCIKNNFKGVYDSYDKTIEYTVQCNECRKYKAMDQMIPIYADDRLNILRSIARYNYVYCQQCIGQVQDKFLKLLSQANDPNYPMTKILTEAFSTIKSTISVTIYIELFLLENIEVRHLPYLTSNILIEVGIPLEYASVLIRHFKSLNI